MIDFTGATPVWYYYHHDALGNVIALSNNSGIIAESYEYTPYGSVTIYGNTGTDITLTGSTIANPYMFTARRYDKESGLYHYRARMYSPQLGRFLQTDPIGYGDGMNMYAYCGNNPVNYIDPWGLASVALYNSNDPRRDGWADLSVARTPNHRNEAGAYDYAIPVNSINEAVAGIRKLKKQGIKIDLLAIIDHGKSGDQNLGGQDLLASDPRWAEIAAAVEEAGEIYLKGCSVAKDQKGQDYIQGLAETGGRVVKARTMDWATLPKGNIFGIRSFNLGGIKRGYPKGKGPKPYNMRCNWRFSGAYGPW